MHISIVVFLYFAMYIYISSSVIYQGASRKNPKTNSGIENPKFRLGMSGIWHISQMLHSFLWWFKPRPLWWFFHIVFSNILKHTSLYLSDTLCVTVCKCPSCLLYCRRKCQQIEIQSCHFTCRFCAFTVCTGFGVWTSLTTVVTWGFQCVSSFILFIFFAPRRIEVHVYVEFHIKIGEVMLPHMFHKSWRELRVEKVQSKKT